MKLWIILAVLFVQACAVVEPPPAPLAPTLASLQPVQLPDAPQVLPQPDLAELAQTYRSVLEYTRDPATRVQIQHRLADIALLAGEARMSDDSAPGEAQVFADSINAYRQLLQAHPFAPGNDQLLYQLSRAYALAGDVQGSLAALGRLVSDFPDSEHVVEARFRLGEHYFAQADYGRAEQAYAAVVSDGRNTPYYINAQYMQAWSRFKRGHYGQAVAPLTGVLDGLLPADGSLKGLSPGERELAQDSVHVLALIFSYLQGPQAIARVYQKLGARPYEEMLYSELADLYLSQQRYRDSAQALRAFMATYPDAESAPAFQRRVIKAFEQGNFPELVVAEKAVYVDTFAVGGRYWRQSAAPLHDTIRPQLQQYIRELAGYYHALAQQPSSANTADVTAGRYREAADYYQLYIDSFPGDPQLPEMAFLLGESRFEAGDYAAAIAAYESVAYEHSDHPRAAEAGYAALLAYQRLAGTANTADTVAADKAMLLRRVNSELRFAATFGGDAHAAEARGSAAQTLLHMGDYARAVTAAEPLIQAGIEVDQAIVVPAWLVVGHGSFAQRDYGRAERAYNGALAAMGEHDPRREATLERLAASIYKQAEVAASAGEHLQAAQLFGRAMAVAPSSAVGVSAQYDAADNYIQAGEWARANELLLDFRQRYPAHELTASIPALLIGNYEKLQQWQLAARELDAIAAQKPAAEPQREAAYLAAQYYERAGANALAVARYRSYAHGWERPVTPRFEAMHRLAMLYRAAGEPAKRRYWLRKMISVHDKAGSAGNARTLYLAAEASSILADDAFQSYRGVKLAYPLKKSLRRKKNAMQRALDAYQKTNAYAVEAFSTLATYRMARVYQLLSAELMASPRPGNLDGLASEQYEVLLEEQAFPIEEKAIAVFETNIRRSHKGVYDQWVKRSFAQLEDLLPARYHKPEQGITFSREIY